MGKIVNESTVEVYGKEESMIPMNIESETCLEGDKKEEEKVAEDVILEALNPRLENGKLVNGHTVEFERKEETDIRAEIVVQTFPLRNLEINFKVGIFLLYCERFVSQ